jgi:Zn-dependent protease/predicted transcriptional regulator
LFAVGETQVRLHLTFLLLLVWIGAAQWLHAGPQQAVQGVIFILLLFLSVLLHEFGHVFAARRYGIRTPDITLLPIGGVASLERMPEKPSQEILVALAGPMVNVAIAAILLLVLGAKFDLSHVANLEEAQSSLLARVAAANLALAVFNLIPAFPMDGGRVLRALLATRFGYTEATRYAANVGQAVAVVFGFLGLLGNPLLVLIAVFVFLAASGESRTVEMRELARGFLAKDAMITTFERLSPDSTADDAARLLLSTTQQEFPVITPDGIVKGVVTRDALIEALRDKGGSTPVTDFMKTEIPTVRGTTCLENVIPLLMEGRAPAVAVAGQDQKVLGFITAENLAEAMMVGRARRRA